MTIKREPANGMRLRSFTAGSGMPVKTIKRMWIGVCLCAFVAGCGMSPGGDGRTTPAGDAAAAVSITDFAGRAVSLAEYPRRIIALGNGEADIVFALGGELVGRPTSSTAPANEAFGRIEQIGTAHEVDLERITLLRPDVVLGNDPMNAKDVPVLEGIGAQVVLTSANAVDDVKRQIGLIGRLLGKEERADELIRDIEEGEAAYREQPADAKPRVLLVYGAPGTFMAALPNSLSGDILETAGGINIAADYPRLQSYPQYAQMNAERIVEANPQLIFIMTHGDPEAVQASFVKEMQSNASWNGIDAVRNGQVEALPADLFGTNPGTRIVEAIAYMRDKLAFASAPE